MYIIFKLRIGNGLKKMSHLKAGKTSILIISQFRYKGIKSLRARPVTEGQMLTRVAA